MKIGNFDTSKNVFIVAEAGVNHEGSFDEAVRLVKAAKQAGADAVKFQTYLPAEYIAASETERFERVSRFALSFEQFKKLSEVAKKEGIMFFSTPLDPASVDALNSYVPVMKISSGDMNFKPLVQYIAAKKKPVIISTGTASLAEVKKSLSWIAQKTSKNFVKEKVAVLHCVAAYPAPFESVNLHSIQYLEEQLGMTIGYSDHTPGVEVPPMAVAAGARIIEKHFTLSREGKVFRDHYISLTPDEFADMVARIRRVETALGIKGKMMSEAEKANVANMRRGIAAKEEIPAGKTLKASDLTFVRPQRDFTYEQAVKLVGSKVKRTIAKGHLVQKTDIR